MGDIVEKKSKKMVVTEGEIREHQRRCDMILLVISELGSRPLETQEGRKARDEETDQLQLERTRILGEIRTLEARLEVEMVQLIVGRDTELAEEQPPSAISDEQSS